MQLSAVAPCRILCWLLIAPAALSVVALPAAAQELDPPWAVVQAAAEKPDPAELRSLLQKMPSWQRYDYLKRAMADSPPATIQAILAALGARRGGLAWYLIGGVKSALEKGDGEQADRVLGLALAHIDDPKDLGRLVLLYADAGRWSIAGGLLHRGGRIDDQEILNRVGAGNLDFVLWVIDQGYDARGIGAMAFRWNSDLLHQLAVHGLSPEEAEAVSPERPRQRALAYLRVGADPCLNKIWHPAPESPGAESPSPQILGRCLRVALSDGRVELARLHLDAGADAGFVPKEVSRYSDMTTLELAAELGDLELLRKLRRAGSPETFGDRFQTPSRIFWKEFAWVGYGPEDQMNHDLGGHTLRIPALFDSGCTTPAEPEWDIECASDQGLTVRAAFRESLAAHHELRLRRSLGINWTPVSIFETKSGEVEPEGWACTYRGRRGQLDIKLEVEGHRLNAPEIDLIAQYIFYDVKPAVLPPYMKPGNLALIVVLGITAVISLMMLLFNRPAAEPWSKPDVWV